MGLVFRGQPRPTPRRRGPSAPQFWKFPSIYAYTLCRRTNKFDVVADVRRGCILGSATPPITSEVPALPNFWGSPVCPHLLMMNDQIRQAEGRVFRSTTPLLLEKCVARFVSNTWVFLYEWYPIEVLLSPVVSPNGHSASETHKLDPVMMPQEIVRHQISDLAAVTDRQDNKTP